MEERNLTDADVEAIAKAITSMQGHSCRFSDISEEDLRAAVSLSKHVEKLLSETGTTVRKTITTIGVTGLVALIVAGIYSKIQSLIAGGP